MKSIKRIKRFQASPEEVFDCLDDLGVTGMHMTESSMPMMGGKMNLEFLTTQKSGLNCKYRWTGKVMWMGLDFTVVVKKWIRGKEKTWETIGNSRIVIYSWFQMHLQINPDNRGCTAQLSISYEKPEAFFNKILCYFLGDWYCKWCLKNMMNDAEQKLSMHRPALSAS